MIFPKLHVKYRNQRNDNHRWYCRSQDCHQSSCNPSSSTNFFFISDTITNPPPNVNALKVNVAKKSFHKILALFSFILIPLLLYLIRQTYQFVQNIGSYLIHASGTEEHPRQKIHTSTKKPLLYETAFKIPILSVLPTQQQPEQA